MSKFALINLTLHNGGRCVINPYTILTVADRIIEDPATNTKNLVGTEIVLAGFPGAFVVKEDQAEVVQMINLLIED